MTAAAVGALLAGDAVAAGAASPVEPNRIVYWGNQKTGASVRVLNTSDAEKKAEAQVKNIGGDGWVLLMNSTQTGFGAAICTGEPGAIKFHIAHGYSTAREAIDAAKQKANGGGAFCSNPMWSVNESSAPREATAVDYIRGTVRRAVSSDRCEWKDAEATKPGASSGGAKEVEASPEQCRQPRNDERFMKGSRFTCMCVRG